MSLLSVIKVLLGESNSAMTLIITKIRLPRILAACVGGGSLCLLYTSDAADDRYVV